MSHAMRTFGIVIAVLFSLLYAALYPILTGRSVIYWYPYWPAAFAAAYVAGGILLQAGYCYARGSGVTARSLASQTLLGFGYLAATMLVPGGLYQS